MLQFFLAFYQTLHVNKINLTNRIYYSPFALFLGNLELLVLPEDDIPLSLMESCAEDALPVASLSRIMLSYPLLPPLW